MKITKCFSAYLVLQASQAFVPQAGKAKTKSTTTLLQEQKKLPESAWWGPATIATAAATSFAGMTLATQVVFANPIVEDVQQQYTAPTYSQFADIPSALVAGQIETMDFSMPSYGDATKGDTTTGKRDIPSFNPFESMMKEDKEEEASTNAAADEKTAAEAKKAQQKTDAEAKKAQEKADVEAKKADKEARRQAEIQKQRDMAERAKREREAATSNPSSELSPAPAPVPAASEGSIPSFSAPEIPEFKAPEFKAPEFKVPDLKAPDFKAPDFKAPDFKAPEIPKFSMPSSPAIPEFKAPQFNTPKMPSFEMPKGGGYDFGSPSSSSSNEVLQPQDVRDQRAREARSVFNDADNEAKEAERTARELRKVATEKKRIANEAKDEACKTRPGGKFLCLRGFGIGY